MHTKHLGGVMILESVAITNACMYTTTPVAHNVVAKTARFSPAQQRADRVVACNVCALTPHLFIYLLTQWRESE